MKQAKANFASVDPRPLSICAALALLGHAALQACSVPVFRYALDRWPADRFQLDVAAKDAKDERVAYFLRNITDSSPLNLNVTRLSDDESATSRLLPPSSQSPAPLWSGALDGSTLDTLTDSPARKEIVRRILSGDAAVFVLVGSGTNAADDAIAARIEKRLKYLVQVTQLPPIDPGDPSSQLGPGPALAAKFSMIRVDAENAAEKAFVAMLAGPNLDEMTNSGTWVAAVFGRGRVLGSWAARSIEDEQVDEVSLFLLGACSCQVKRQNPGWDLLLNVDWDAELQKLGVPEMPSLADTKPLPSPEPEPAPEPAKVETATFAPAPPAPAATAAADGNHRAGILAAAGAAVLAVLGVAFLRHRP